MSNKSFFCVYSFESMLVTKFKAIQREVKAGTVMLFNTDAVTTLVCRKTFQKGKHFYMVKKKKKDIDCCENSIASNNFIIVNMSEKFIFVLLS